MQKKELKTALFLDRDGVLNIEKKGSYIMKPEEFIWDFQVKEALAIAKNHFDYIFIVTNQRGIARNLMTEEDLHAVHKKMQEDLKDFKVQIDGIYYAKGMDLSDPMRKPNPGMGLKIKEDFPDIDWNASVMIGNNISDMEFGKALDLYTVFLYTTQEKQTLPHAVIDAQFANLWEAVQNGKFIK
ncbi:MAG TPA: HAD-IIIA family hydrolase [Chitinophagaceae bacterium]|nr:HAD-IIIA family hydrolase [Chitinophagaceae bacterium]